MTAGRVTFVLLLLVALGAGIGVYTDVSNLAEQIVTFAWWTVAPALALAFSNYVCRFGKWHYFLKVVGYRPELNDSGLVFFSGLAMSVTPGKLGEVLKSYLLKQTSDVPAAASVPVVVAERLTDMLALLVLAAFGVATLGYGGDIMAAAVAICLLVLVPVLWRGCGEWLLDLAAKAPLLSNKREWLGQLRDTMYTLVGARSLAAGTVISVVAWFAECLSFWFILHGVGAQVTLADAVFAYSLGTIAGAVTMLPGGLIATEASMVFLIAELFGRASPSQAVTAVLLVRLCTLWFAVLVGALALARIRKKLGGVDISGKLPQITQESG